MAKKKAATKFPKRLFVHSEDDGDGENQYYSADTSIDGKDHGVEVGIYELREVKVIVVTKEML